jgi:hypothetical protein
LNNIIKLIFEKLMKTWSWLVLIGIALIIRILSNYPEWIELYYSNGFYTWLSSGQRFLLGWLPISLGDLFYGLVIVFLSYKLIKLGIALFKKEVNWKYFFEGLKQFLFFVLFIYCFFNLFWGLNYDRKGIASQLQLDVTEYNLEELKSLTTVLQERLNKEAALVDTNARFALEKKRNLFNESFRAYDSASLIYPFLDIDNKSVKPSLFSYAGNILGFQGYYNPFSGEAQVNTTVPVFLQPFISCHEIAHQIGYAKENEANFVGYLACKAHPSGLFRYSAYFDLFYYAVSEMSLIDSALADSFVEKLHPRVRKDEETMILFYRKFKNPIEPVITEMYDQYLRYNRQPFGKRSYYRVVTWMVAYQKKYGDEAL